MRGALGVLLVVLLFSGSLLLTACSEPAKPAGSAGASSGEPPVSASLEKKADPFAPIPVEGPHEKAALAALPKALKEAAAASREMGQKLTDTTGAEPRLFRYVIFAGVGDKATLFEVHADGKVHELYHPAEDPDPAKLFWQPIGNSEGTYFADPEGDAEEAAAAAVAGVLGEAAPGEKARIAIQGWEFCWIIEGDELLKTSGGTPFTLMVDPQGGAGTWSQ